MKVRNEKLEDAKKMRVNGFIVKSGQVEMD